MILLKFCDDNCGKLMNFFYFQFSLKDQDKVSAQQKSMREAEQERQWKQLQAIRAREQQLGIPPDPQRMQGKFKRVLQSVEGLI